MKPNASAESYSSAFNEGGRAVLPRTLQYALHLLGIAAVMATTGYAILACIAVRRHRLRSPRRTASALLPTTVLKPLCGDEPELYRCLRSFCLQEHPRYQIVFGVHDAADPALSSVRKLQAELPHVDIEVVIDARLHGANRKVSNLINMLSAARYDTVVLADSDVIVDPNYLQRVTAPLADEAVGLVTCIYRARAVTSIWSRLFALFLNEWFIPAVHVAHLFGGSEFSSGATIALRRQTLRRLGGFESVANLLADDYWLGSLTRRLGLKTAVADVVVDTIVTESSLASACRHELRWLRTIRSVQPGSYRLLGVTFTLPVLASGALLAGGGTLVLVCTAVAIAARVLLHHYTREPMPGDIAPSASATPSWLVLCSDFLAFVLWCWSFSSRRVEWRESVLAIGRDGSAQHIA